ncbi:MAG TPA: ABC transporter ATP-binding protein [Myxococcaceae bacterium]|nr:ABC transporter ATP-binding protein [Myxococcaceae bacterium]
MTELAIELKDVEKRFRLNLGVGRRVALDRMNLVVRHGEIYGFLGPNGAGKTTSIKVLTSLLRQDAGTARVLGGEPGLKETRRRVGFLPESPVFYDHLTGREFLHFCGRLCGMERGAIVTRAGRLLERVGLSGSADLQIRRYSKGMNQRIGIAQALIHDPDLVILDEPMSGLDPIGRAEIRDLILELGREGKTVFFSTHIIPDVEIICDRIGLVNRGRLVAEGSVQELLSKGDATSTEILVSELPPSFSVPSAQETPAAQGLRLFTVDSEDRLRTVLSGILEQRGRIISVNPRRETLEDLVVRMIDQDRAAA